ncbi:hypothetical protein LUZ62_059393 [Rhynchospora pubera]|uniref:Uncharacterized protein n=1 Tax=Rhynchospora pubera TaxID=906938 RepID=A0AAV8EAF6_9POAL|nr:hypothetical protein LUZ62_059393 [Rhynchospora pubera]
MGYIADSEGQDSLPDGVDNSEFNQHTLAEHSPVKSVPPEIEFPFEKASPIWKSLETTYKVFSHIPQRPHFKMLESECKETREGTAIGMMVNYANLAESTHRLSIHAEVSVFEEKIACLKSLEKNGFFVDPILSRLHHLFEIKTNLAESALKRVKLETELAKEKQELEDSHASANVCKDKMTDIGKSIAELKEQLSIMEKQIKAVMEERAGILDSAAKREHDISRIEVEISSISRSYELAFEEFGRVVAEPL